MLTFLIYKDVKDEIHGKNEVLVPHPPHFH